jgi:hypothetical protein
MPKSARTSPCRPDEAKARLRTAQAYLEVAGIVLQGATPDGPKLATNLSAKAQA